MVSKIEEIVNRCIAKSISEENMGLLSGNAGIILLLVVYSSWKEKEIDDHLITQIQRIFDNSLVYQSYTLANGKLGINWFFQYLGLEMEILDEGQCDEICCELSQLQELSLIELEEGHWDWLHNSMGAAHISLYNYKETYQAYFKSFFKGLQKICTTNKTTRLFPNYDYKNGVFNDAEINLGLAHGIPSILKFCIQCYKKNICRQEAYDIGYGIVDFLLKHANADRTHCFYPTIYNTDQLNSQLSRLAWCYGDLGIGFILYQAGKTFDDSKIIDFALEILKHTTTRRTVVQTTVYDAGICHGSAGIAHIYNRMWHYTNDIIFKEATDYWIQRTLDFGNHNDGVAGYKAYRPADKSYVNSYNVIEGVAGIGLVLLSYLTGDFSWDYCLMLND